MRRRIVMERPLEPVSLPPSPIHRPVRDTDRRSLARLLYTAYRGTIDDEGGTLRDAEDEIDGLYSGLYGPFLSDCSFVLDQEEDLLSASLITFWPPHDAPLVAFTMTRPPWRGRGLAPHLLGASMNALLQRGESRLTLVVTEGNDPAQRLYTRLGFHPLPRDH